MPQSDNPVTVKALHEQLTRNAIRDHGGASGRDPMFGLGLWFGGLTLIGRHWLLLRKRGVPWSAEVVPSQGQAALWLEQVRREVSPSGYDVAGQLARLCGDDSRVTIPWRDLADAVGKRNRVGKQRSYTERGAKVLVDAGWLTVKTVGRGRGARTTFYLEPGPG